jgi:phosphomannomutase / phosphoglucomutase
MMLFAKELLKNQPNSTIVYDVKCSRFLEDIIKQYHGHPIMWKTGHSFIKAKIKETNAALAGEMSGHLFFNDRWFGFDDALYAGARLLEILANDPDRRSLDDQMSLFPQTVNTPELKIMLDEQEKWALIDAVCTQGDFKEGKLITLDGLRVEFNAGWGLIRASNTTPCVVLRFEADNAQNLSKIQQLFKENLIKINSKLKIPF